MRLITKGATDQTIYFDVLDSSSTTGARLTGLVYNTASLTAYYTRNRAAAVQINLATLAAANSAHSDGGFKEVDATNAPGLYRLDLPDAAVATGADSVVVTIKGASNMAQVSYDIQLIGADLQDSVRGGLTALPNAAADAAGGLPISDAGGLDLDAQIGTKIDGILEDTGTTLPATLGAPAGASLAADVAAVKSQTADIEADTQDLQTQIGTDGAGLTNIPWNASWDAEVQSECADALAAYDPPTNTEMEARTLAAASYATATALTTVDGVVDGIKAVTDNLPDSGALTSLATASALAVVGNTAGAVKAKTDQLNFGVTGALDANITHVNETGVGGTGVEGDEWGPGA